MGDGTRMNPATPSAPGSLRLIRITLGMLGLFLALGWLAKGLIASPVDGQAKQREYFGTNAPPLGLSLGSAVHLPTGDVLVRFTRPEDGEPGPVDVIFIEYRERAAVAPLFRSTESGGPGMMDGAGQRLKEWEKEKAFDWHTTMRRGEIAWAAWSTKLLVERSFRKGGGWVEEARVDLSSPERALVLFAHWPVEVAVDEKALRDFLRAIVLTPAGE